MAAQTSLLLIAIVVIIIIVVVAFVLSRPSVSTYTSTVASSTTSATSITSTTNQSSSNSTVPGVIISASQAASLVGSGGNYNYTSTNNQGEINAFLEYYMPGYTGNYNVTQVYGMSYNISQRGAAQNITLSEVVLNATYAQPLYTEFLNYTNSTLTNFNGTVNGLKYSYTWGAYNGTTYSSLLGWKGSNVAYVIATGYMVNATNLAKIVASET